MTEQYIVLDLETTGLSPRNDRILEIGAAKVTDGCVQEVYQTFVDPRMRIPERITELTGITDEMVCGQKSNEQAVRELVEFCGNLPLLGHNILFDYGFVKYSAVNLGIPFERNGIDTLRIARELLPAEEKKSLEALCSRFSISKEHAHRALDDALATHELYMALERMCPEEKETLFVPSPLICRVKRQGDITPAQKGYLKDLVTYHKIELEIDPESLTKNEASRLIDKIILNYGKIRR